MWFHSSYLVHATLLLRHPAVCCVEVNRAACVCTVCVVAVSHMQRSSNVLDNNLQTHPYTVDNHARCFDYGAVSASC